MGVLLGSVETEYDNNKPGTFGIPDNLPNINSNSGFHLFFYMTGSYDFNNRKPVLLDIESVLKKINVIERSLGMF